MATKARQFQGGLRRSPTFLKAAPIEPVRHGALNRAAPTRRSKKISMSAQLKARHETAMTTSRVDRARAPWPAATAYRAALPKARAGPSARGVAANHRTHH